MASAGVIIPFVFIKLIDVLLVAVHLVMPTPMLRNQIRPAIVMTLSS